MSPAFRALCLLVTTAVVAASPDSAQAQSARDIARRTFPSVVTLVMENPIGRPIASGSGFFVREDAIATNAHVIEGAKAGYVRSTGGMEKYRIEGVFALDSERDLAVVKVSGMRGTGLPLGDPDALAVGDEVYAVGSPLGLEGTFSNGLVSAVRRDSKMTMLQITAPISPGSSGGPVLNAKGEVVGLATLTFVKGQNLNFAVSVAHLRPLLANLTTVSALSAVPEPKVARPQESDEEQKWRSEILMQFYAKYDEVLGCAKSVKLAETGIQAAVKQGNSQDAARFAQVQRNGLACIESGKQTLLVLQGMWIKGPAGIAAAEDNMRKEFERDAVALLTELKRSAEMLQSPDLAFEPFTAHVDAVTSQMQRFADRHVRFIGSGPDRTFARVVVEASRTLTGISSSWKGEGWSVSRAEDLRRKLEAQRRSGREMSEREQLLFELDRKNLAVALRDRVEHQQRRQNYLNDFGRLLNEAVALAPRAAAPAKSP